MSDQPKTTLPGFATRQGNTKPPTPPTAMTDAAVRMHLLRIDRVPLDKQSPYDHAVRAEATRRGLAV